MKSFLKLNSLLGLTTLSALVSLNSYGMGMRHFIEGLNGKGSAPATVDTQASANAKDYSASTPVVSAKKIDPSLSMLIQSSPESGNVCARLPENGFSKMSPTLNYFDDVIAGDYLLMRQPTQNGVDQYDLVLNYQFVGSDASAPKRVTDCFESMREFLIGPNGEQIHLRLPLPGDPMLPKAHNVMISSACGFRGEAECWRPVYTCATVLHETMHHLGLVDEYAQLPCRSLGPADSLMTNPGVAETSIRPSYVFHTYKCDVLQGADHETCLQSLSEIESGAEFKRIDFYTIQFADGHLGKMYERSTPGFPQQSSELFGNELNPPQDLHIDQDGFLLPNQTADAYTAAAAQWSKPTRVGKTQLNYIEVIPAKRKSILYPLEASTLLYGKCAANSVFLSCEHGAYDTHFCGGKPAICGGGQPTDTWLQIQSGMNP